MNWTMVGFQLLEEFIVENENDPLVQNAVHDGFLQEEGLCILLQRQVHDHLDVSIFVLIGIPLIHN